MTYNGWYAINQTKPNLRRILVVVEELEKYIVDQAEPWTHTRALG